MSRVITKIMCVCGGGRRLPSCSEDYIVESRDYEMWRESRTMESNKKLLECHHQGLAPWRAQSTGSSTESRRSKWDHGFKAASSPTIKLKEQTSGLLLESCYTPITCSKRPPEVLFEPVIYMSKSI